MSLCVAVSCLKVMIFLIAFPSFHKADDDCRHRFFREVADGGPLLKNIISSFVARSWLDCGQQCLREATCVAFNYLSRRTNNKPNCLLTNDTTEPEKIHYTSDHADEWKFYKAIDVPPQPCLKNVCENGGQCFRNSCGANEFTCKCDAKFTGKLCEVERVFKNCKDVLSTPSPEEPKDGTYNIKTNTPSGHTKVYCQMTPLPGCSDGGWTMVMKIDGAKSTFNFTSPYWSNDDCYNLAGGLTAFDDQETKLPTYTSTSFTEICIGMKVGSDARFTSISYPGTSLYSLIADGIYRQTKSGRNNWMSLISGSFLQQYCDKEGFNVEGTNRNVRVVDVRLGILGNNENNCDSPDSFIGLGGRVFHQTPYCSSLPMYPDINVAGNLASCSSGNVFKNVKAMAYIMVR